MMALVNSASYRIRAFSPNSSCVHSRIVSMSCSASGDSRYSVIGHLPPELLLAALGRPPAEPANEVRELLFPSSVVLSPRSSEANASDARLRSAALNFSSFSFDSCSRRRSLRASPRWRSCSARRNQTFHEMVVVIRAIDRLILGILGNGSVELVVRSHLGIPHGAAIWRRLLREVCLPFLRPYPILAAVMDGDIPSRPSSL